MYHIMTQWLYSYHNPILQFHTVLKHSPKIYTISYDTGCFNKGPLGEMDFLVKTDCNLYNSKGEPTVL